MLSRKLLRLLNCLTLAMLFFNACQSKPIPVSLPVPASPLADMPGPPVTQPSDTPVPLPAPSAEANQDGLVAFFPFDEGAIDVVGENNGVIARVSLAPDRFGRPDHAYFFNGADDYIELPTNLNLIDDRFTVSAWIQPKDFGFISTTSPDCRRVIFAYRYNAHADPDPSNSGLVFYLSRDLGCSGKSYLGLDYIGPDYYFRVIKTDILPGDDWFLFSVTKTADEMALYVNGERLLTRAIPSGVVLESPDFPYASIGIFHRWEETFFFPFYGAIDDLRIYNRALTDAEALALYRSDD